MCVIFEYKCGMFAPSAQSVWGSEKKRCPPRLPLICFPPAEAALSCDSTITLKPRRCNCAAVVSKRQRDVNRLHVSPEVHLLVLTVCKCKTNALGVLIIDNKHPKELKLN